MILNKLLQQNTILETAMQATSYKNDVILGNIANIDTPNYKRKTVQFEDALSNAINETKKTGTNQMINVMKNIKVRQINDDVTLDGNGVDLETEMVEFYKNSSKYDAIVNSVKSNSSIASSVYQAFS